MPNLLLIDDDPTLTAQLRAELGNRGYAVRVAGDGCQGLAEFERSEPDLVVLDWGLRGATDGIDLLRRIRQRAGTPVLMLTARDSLPDKLIGFGAGADDYLVKPFALPELFARLQALDRRRVAAPTSRATPRLSDEGIELDADAHSVAVDGTHLALTRGEFALLRILMAHQGRAFHRDHLLRRLRGHDYAGTERAIDNLVVRLRRKLGRCGPRIETVFGIGYRWTRRSPP